MFELGALESDVMHRLWEAEEKLSVHDLVATFGESRKLAYTTVLTVVTHLYEKGWVIREKRRRAYFYEPTRDRAAAVTAALRKLLVAGGDPLGTLQYFASTLTGDEYAALARGLDTRERNVASVSSAEE